MLSLLIFLPGIFAVILLFARRRGPRASRGIAFGGSIATLVYGLYILVSRFNLDQAGYQVQDRAPWIASLHVGYHVGIDGVSLLLVFLTTILTPVAILMSDEEIVERVPLFMTLLLVLETSLLGVFLSLDLVLFYVFWEAVLIPLYLLIGVFGGERRVYAALKYVLYTMIGSLLMLVGVVGVYVYSGVNSFDIPLLTRHPVAASLQMGLFILFGVAFAVKAALWPFHSWVPDVYTESATPTTILLSGVVSKMGVYGFLRIGLPFFPSAMRSLAIPLSTLAVIGIIYGALLALVQNDGKRLVACSSVSHMCFILLGVFVLNTQGILGATIQMVNHGVTTAALFAILGAVAWRWGTIDLRRLEGLGARARVLAAIFLVVALSALGLPGLNQFAGEFLILLGAFKSAAIFGVGGTIGVVLAAWYMVRLYQSVMNGPEMEQGASPTRGVSLRANEATALAPLLVLIVWIGVAPGGWLHPASYAVQQIVTLVGGGR